MKYSVVPILTYIIMFNIDNITVTMDNCFVSAWSADVHHINYGGTPFNDCVYCI